jgi:hypothetical protein
MVGVGVGGLDGVELDDGVDRVGADVGLASADAERKDVGLDRPGVGSPGDGGPASTRTPNSAATTTVAAAGISQPTEPCVCRRTAGARTRDVR